MVMFCRGLVCLIRRCIDWFQQFDLLDIVGYPMLFFPCTSDTLYSFMSSFDEIGHSWHTGKELNN